MKLAHRQTEENLRQEISRLKDEISRLSDVRRKAEGMAKSRIEHMRRNGQTTEAERLEAELGEIIGGDKGV